MTYVSLELQYRPLSPVIEEICEKAKLPRISGGSGRGWSSWSAFQRCPRLWQLKYMSPPTFPDAGEVADSRPARDIGTAFHAFLVFHYVDYGLEPEWLCEKLLAERVNKEAVHEAWRIFGAYRYYYQNDYIVPLAAEFPVLDKRSKRTCRYDLIAEVPKDNPLARRGIYIVEHKTAGRFDDVTLDGWDLDGEVLGQIVLWKRAGLDKEFGELQGVIVNIAGKQKVPDFYRVFVSPNSFPVVAYWNDLDLTEKALNRCIKTGYFPKYLNGCIARYGKCDFYNHCRSRGDDDDGHL